MIALSHDELARYSRQINLRALGEEGQQRLKAARVLCIGAGGLGSPAALYLAAAGVGTIGIVDDDAVDVSNLHRQLLHDTADVQRRKVDSAAERLTALNPHITIETHVARLNAINAEEMITPYDIVIDGSDNLPTRYLSNDVCVWLKKPNVYGSVHQFEGQASIFAPHLGAPCYRCLFPEPPPPGVIPSCAEAGVLGVVPGIIGTIQALETIKLITGIGQTLLARLLHLDALTLRLREFNIRRDPHCPVCGQAPTITEPAEYEQSCQTDAAIPEISAIELQSMLWREERITLLDVREPFEWEIARINDSILIPMGDIPDRLGELRRDNKIVVYCKSGVRSAQAIAFMHRQGFSQLLNLRGGIDAWREQIDPSLRKY